MKYLLITILFQCFSLLVYAQEVYYESNFTNLDSNVATALVEDSNGNYLLATVVRSYTTNQVSSCISKISTSGEVIDHLCDTGLFEKTTIRDIVLSGVDWIAAGDIQETDVNLYYSYYYKGNDSEATAYLPLSTEIKNYANALSTTTNNEVLLAGGMFNDTTDPPTLELHLMKVDSMGIEQWNRTYYAFTKNNSYEDIISLADGTFYGLATVRDDYWQQANVALLHLSSEGIPITIKEYDLGGRDLARCLIATHDGGVLFSASAYPTNNGYEGSGYLYKLDAMGETTWINNTDFQATVIHGLVQLSDSSYVVAGNYYVDEDTYDGFIAKLNSSGQVLWRRSYGGNRTEYIYDLIANHQDASGRAGYVMCGRTESSDLGVPLGNANLYLLKTNCMGLLTEPQAAFSATMDTAALTASFQNLSEFVYPDSIDGGHYIWEFGDGAVSSEINPTHTYAQEGSYEVKLRAVVCSDTSVFVQNVCIGTLEQPVPSFVYSLQNDSLVTFTNTSSNAADAVFIWNFGDGTSSSEQNPIHAYTQAGEHEVRLSVVLCQDTTVFVQVVTTFAVGLPQIGMGEFAVYPNPAQDHLVVENNNQEQSATFVLYDVMGRRVLSVISHNQSVVPIEHLPSGVYLYQFLNPQNQILTYGRISVVR